MEIERIGCPSCRRTRDRAFSRTFFPDRSRRTKLTARAPAPVGRERRLRPGSRFFPGRFRSERRPFPPCRCARPHPPAPGPARRDQIIRLAGNGALHMGAQLRNRLGCFGPGHLHVAGKYDGFAVKRVGGVCIRVCLHVLQGCTLAGKGRVAAVCRAFRFSTRGYTDPGRAPCPSRPHGLPGTVAAAPSPPKAGACISRK